MRAHFQESTPTPRNKTDLPDLIYISPSSLLYWTHGVVNAFLHYVVYLNMYSLPADSASHLEHLYHVLYSLTPFHGCHTCRPHMLFYCAFFSWSTQVNWLDPLQYSQYISISKPLTQPLYGFLEMAHASFPASSRIVDTGPFACVIINMCSLCD